MPAFVLLLLAALLPVCAAAPSLDMPSRGGSWQPFSRHAPQEWEQADWQREEWEAEGRMYRPGAWGFDGGWSTAYRSNYLGVGLEFGMHVNPEAEFNARLELGFGNGSHGLVYGVEMGFRRRWIITPEVAPYGQLRAAWYQYTADIASQVQALGINAGIGIELGRGRARPYFEANLRLMAPVWDSGLDTSTGLFSLNGFESERARRDARRAATMQFIPFRFGVRFLIG
jgi:hypothetical protein